MNTTQIDFKQYCQSLSAAQLAALIHIATDQLNARAHTESSLPPLPMPGQPAQNADQPGYQRGSAGFQKRKKFVDFNSDDVILIGMGAQIERDGQTWFVHECQLGHKVLDNDDRFYFLKYDLVMSFADSEEPAEIRVVNAQGEEDFIYLEGPDDFDTLRNQLVEHSSNREFYSRFNIV